MVIAANSTFIFSLAVPTDVEKINFQTFKRYLSIRCELRGYNELRCLNSFLRNYRLFALVKVKSKYWKVRTSEKERHSRKCACVLRRDLFQLNKVWKCKLNIGVFIFNRSSSCILLITVCNSIWHLLTHWNFCFRIIVFRFSSFSITYSWLFL